MTPEAERRLRQGHPWLYDQAIRRQSHKGQPGDLAVIFDRRDRFLAIGLYDPESSIRVRILQHLRPASIDAAWYEKRLTEALALRAGLAISKTTGYRLVHGENDRLPGLVVDRYGQTIVIKIYTVAWAPHLHDFLAVLKKVYPFQKCILRFSRTVQARAMPVFGARDGAVLSGPHARQPVSFAENGLQFEADPIKGHKTGFFLDQRENRAKVERLSRGRTVLDAFAYTGAFSVYAARGGARSVTSIDISRPALQAAKRHMVANRNFPGVAAAAHEILVGEAFEVLERMRRSRRQFDLIVLDPPTFAKSEGEAASAITAYFRLAGAGLGVLKSGGCLVASSCSNHVGADDFFAAVHRAALQSGRRLKEIDRTLHPSDHPVRFKEGAYLKCLFAVAA